MIQYHGGDITGSILNDIKKLLGITEDYHAFDTDIIVHINTTFSILNDMGIGPEKPFSIVNSENKWSEFINDDETLLKVKTYIYLKVRLLFDPPQSSSVLEAYNNQIKELEWRMYSKNNYI